MQVHPDVVEGYTTGTGPEPDNFNYAVANLVSLQGTLLGKAVFDRTVAPDPASPFGRGTDSWHWLTEGSEWPAAGFVLRIGSNPTFDAVDGSYAIWDDSPFVSTRTPPPATDRYRVVQVTDEGETTVGELLVEKVDDEWRQTWWADTLVNDRIAFLKDTDYRFEAISGATTLDTTTLHTCVCGLVGLTTITL